MDWEALLSLKRHGDTRKRLRKEQDETRLGFEVDYDRIIFSSAFRSLQDKTQVIPLSKTDFVHTRLTHSLEVSVVGRSLGRAAGIKILENHPHLKEVHGYAFNDFGAIVAAAALAHDIGNPPFGHSGEKAIGEFFKNGEGQKYRSALSGAEYQDLIAFEGNANGFQLLTRSADGIPGGLRLSYATLGAFMKYPKESLPKKPTSHIADKKFGFFQSDKEAFRDVAETLGLPERSAQNAMGETKTKKADNPQSPDNINARNDKKAADDEQSGNRTGAISKTSYARHPLTFLVEAADDICYTIIDFEDGINLGLIPEDYAQEYLINLVKDRIATNKYRAMDHQEDRLSYLRALAINTLIADATKVFLENEKEILSGAFDTSLLERSRYRALIEDIIGLSVDRIYLSNEVVEKEIAGYRIIADILEVYTNALTREKDGKSSSYDRLLLRTLPPMYRNTTDSLYSVLLNTACYVASLSDSTAVHIHNKITGESL